MFYLVDACQSVSVWKLKHRKVVNFTELAKMNSNASSPSTCLPPPPHLHPCHHTIREGAETVRVLCCLIGHSVFLEKPMIPASKALLDRSPATESTVANQSPMVVTSTVIKEPMTLDWLNSLWDSQFDISTTLAEVYFYLIALYRT